jgi:antitoxin ChpS
MSHTAILRKVGGSVMLAIPPALLDVTGLTAGRQVAVSIEGGRLVIEPEERPRYTLDQLLAKCDASAPRSPLQLADEREWLESGPAGNELL